MHYFRNVPVAVVDPRLCAEKLLLPGLVGEVPSHLVAVLLGLQRRNQVYPRPHLLACEFAMQLSVLLASCDIANSCAAARRNC